MVGRSPSGRATRASTEPASSLGHSASVPNAACRNCAGEQWVCENHQDRPWNELLAPEGCECGAGAPCPVCNRDAACAGYIPWWKPMETAPKDGTEILISGGTFSDDRDCFDNNLAMRGVAIVRWVHSVCDDGWRGEQRAHDEYLWHKPARWMPLPKAPGEPAGQEPDGEADAPNTTHGETRG